MKRNFEESKFCPNQPMSLAHRNAIKNARIEDVSYHRKVSKGVIDKQTISFDGLKRDANKLKHLVSMVRQIYYLENPFEASDSTLAAAVWTDECRKFYQEKAAKLEGQAESAAPAEAEVWSNQRITELKAKIKKARLAVEISKKLGCGKCTVSMVLGGFAGYTGQARQKWLPKIEKALNELAKDSITIAISPKAKKEMLQTMNFGTRKAAEAAEKTLVSFPVCAPSLISAMMIDIQDGRLKVTMEVDVNEAIRLYAHQLPLAGSE